MIDETKKYLRSQEGVIQTPEEISPTDKLMEIIDVINNQLSPGQRGDLLDGKLDTKVQIVSNCLDFVRLTLKYIIFDNEALKRENAQLHSLLEDEDGCDLAS